MKKVRIIIETFLLVFGHHEILLKADSYRLMFMFHYALWHRSALISAWHVAIRVYSIYLD